MNLPGILGMSGLRKIDSGNDVSWATLHFRSANELPSNLL
jgi:hypothetical protein